MDSQPVSQASSPALPLQAALLGASHLVLCVALPIALVTLAPAAPWVAPVVAALHNPFIAAGVAGVFSAAGIEMCRRLPGRHSHHAQSRVQDYLTWVPLAMSFALLAHVLLHSDVAALFMSPEQRLQRALEGAMCRGPRP